MILSAAHTPKWFEGPQGCMEGSTWHHVCFMEDHHISAIAVALGYLGDILTPAGIDIVLKAIEKAWQQVNHTCEEKGYRWYMNQGLVGNRGRIIGAAILHHYGWGYDTFIEKSYEDHTKILYNYLNEEGHCPEGAYYQYSFSNAVLLWLTYAKYKKTAVRDVVPDRFLQSIQYVESMMSTTEDAGYAMPVNCSRFIPFNMTLLVFLTTVCKWDRGYEYLSHRKYSTDTEDETKLGLDLMILLHWMPTTIQKKKVVEKKLQVFDNGGLLSYRFHENRGGKLWFLCERNPLTGHYHEDRGSVVLEVGGKMLLLDPGTTNYSNMASAYMSRKEYHNVAYPEGVEMYICNEIAEKSAAEAGVGCTTDIGAEDFMDPVPGKITYAQKEDGICFGCDLQPIYRQVFKARRDGILQLHASGGFLTLKDAWKFDESRRLNANFLSYYPWLVEGHKAESNVENIQMTIHFIEENDLPLYLTVDDFMIDSNGRKVYTLRVQSAAAKEVELCSTLHFYTKKALPSIEQPNIFAKK